MNSQFDLIFSRLLFAVFAGGTAVSFAAHADIPDVLAAPANQVVLLEAKADGVQIYECKTKQNAPSEFEWAFKAPEANLYDAKGKQIAHHFAGPTWESPDGSKVVGEIKAKFPAPDARSIPWLLLSAKSNSGAGIFERVASIQRVNTEGGQAPAEACNQSISGKEARIPYKATYRFFVPMK